MQIFFSTMPPYFFLLVHLYIFFFSIRYSNLVKKVFDETGCAWASTTLECMLPFPLLLLSFLTLKTSPFAILSLSFFFAMKLCQNQ